MPRFIDLCIPPSLSLFDSTKHPSSENILFSYVLGLNVLRYLTSPNELCPTCCCCYWWCVANIASLNINLFTFEFRYRHIPFFFHCSQLLFPFSSPWGCQCVCCVCVCTSVRGRERKTVQVSKLKITKSIPRSSALTQLRMLINHLQFPSSRIWAISI